MTEIIEVSLERMVGNAKIGIGTLLKVSEIIANIEESEGRFSDSRKKNKMLQQTLRLLQHFHSEYHARLLRCAISRANFCLVNLQRACQDLGCLYLIDLHRWFDILFHILHVFFDYFLNVTFPFSIIRPRGLLPAGRRRPERS